MDSKRRRICSNKGDLHCQLDAKSYISLILTSLGYEDVSNEIKDELESFVQEWMKQFSNTITIKNIDTKVYDILHQIYPSHWKVFLRYSSSKKTSPKMNITKENNIEELSSDSYEMLEEEMTTTCKAKINPLPDDIVSKHMEFLDRRSLLLDKDVYMSSRLCLSTLSSSTSFITETAGKSPSHVICQFANLVLFYTICSQISQVSQLYHINQEELHKSLNASIQFPTKLNPNQTITNEYQKLSKKKRKVTKKSEEPSQLPDEYDFINSMLYSI